MSGTFDTIEREERERAKTAAELDDDSLFNGKQPSAADNGNKSQDTPGDDAHNINVPETRGNAGNSGNSPENTGKNAFPDQREHSGNNGNAPPPGYEAPSGFSIYPENGLYYKDDDGKDHWIAKPIYVTALTRNSDSEGWGRLLEFYDPDGRLHRWACPMEMLASDGAEFRRTLMSMGLEIAPGRKPRELLATYVQSKKVDHRAISTDRTGWYRGNFVLPDETIGNDGNERVLLQVNSDPPKMGQSGGVDEWAHHLGSQCIGNSRLAFSVSMAFAAPLLEISGKEPGGFHIVGQSSTGKTACLRVAASVWGAPDFMHRWRATSNGLEAVAQSHNDGLLILDELAQVDPRQAGETAYMLANGSGKHRARKDGQAKPAASWRLLFLSAGEIDLADHMAKDGKRTSAGQEVRMADIPADTGVHGAFEDLHDAISGSVFADQIGQSAARYYGAPIRYFLQTFTTMPRDRLKERIDQIIDDFVSETLPENANGQAKRVCSRFGLIAAGGEMATHFGITGWPKGEAIQAAQKCFKAWLNRRGGAGSQEDAKAIAQVRHFIESHGEYRFADNDAPNDRPVPNRAGFKEIGKDGTRYMILREVFRNEVCEGLDHVAVAKALKAEGLLVCDQDRYTLKRRNYGNVYCLKGGIHEA